LTSTGAPVRFEPAGVVVGQQLLAPHLRDAAVADAVATANSRLARVQQVKTWQLLPVEWTADTEELTPTLKLKRRIVHGKYADVIDTLYAR